MDFTDPVLVALAEAFRRADLTTPQRWAKEDWPTIAVDRAAVLEDALGELGYRVVPA